MFLDPYSVVLGGGGGVLGGAYPDHITQHYKDQGTSGPGVTDAVLNYITRILNLSFASRRDIIS